MKIFVAMLLMMLAALPGLAQSAVDNCCQVNRSCATDGDWTQGWFDYQAGQCPASAPAGAPQPAPTTAGVDNCCQVNRSCTADSEWIQGYNDYQAGLCPVSAPAGASQPAPAAPAPAADVDNCCQVNRSCAADAEWIQGYNDYQAGQCGGGSASAPMSSVSGANSYSFSGTGKSATRAFTLTRGKWRFNPNLGRSADTFLVQVSSPGQANPSGTCLTFPSNFHFRGESAAGLRLQAYAHEFAVRYQCDAQFVVFPEVSAGDVQGQSWTININKTDGNI